MKPPIARSSKFTCKVISRVEARHSEVYTGVQLSNVEVQGSLPQGDVLLVRVDDVLSLRHWNLSTSTNLHAENCHLFFPERKKQKQINKYRSDA
jgi:hypothetical protein